MRLAAAAVVLGAGVITSAQLSSIPQCSVRPVRSMPQLHISFQTNPCSLLLKLSCLTSALGADGCSELTDFACHCSKTGLVDQVVPCVKKACDVKDQQAVSSVVVSLCSGVGHPVSVPPVDTSAPTSTAAGSATTTSTTSSSFNSNTVSGLGGGPRTSSTASKTSTLASTTASTVNTASPSSTSLSNGASGIGSGAAQVAGTAILLASMMFLF
ncbi:hypothetical protein Asppvi_006321 [Aspergillus pseudoviridinutans]|uniref:CFEM domain-containing protein n=1 Tax=Aspergillus pseudoviridinutans TaxID=1517512 RepID=A0A9P3EW41_9EURO|nr:uncharacterized protein Asppvi_006321 [Aspergillus pseudoviridinutans]GIJ87415.1 hypothetical protein Asppvi_006321 [Aspergillus pseudoviridinutans]